MLRQAAQERLIPPEVSYPLMEVVSLANRAIHGEFVRAEDAEEIARVGVRGLEALRALPDADEDPGQGDGASTSVT
jgi:hypothetical protein